LSDLAKTAPIGQKILFIRGKKIMLSHDLAELYGVPPKALIQAVKRNRERFPEDFMFQMSLQESRNLKSQIVTSSWGGARRALPYAFTEQGVAMLSSVLRSKRAIRVNIEIMRAFARFKEVLSTHKKLAKKLEDLENAIGEHDSQIQAIFGVIRELITEPKRQKRRIGFL
jgi:hypothetical protein